MLIVAFSKSMSERQKAPTSPIRIPVNKESNNIVLLVIEFAEKHNSKEQPD